MPSTGIFHPEHLAIITKVLDEHCLDHGIERSSPDYVDRSYAVMSLFRGGAQTAADLKTALEAVSTGRERRNA